MQTMMMESWVKFVIRYFLNKLIFFKRCGKFFVCFTTSRSSRLEMLCRKDVLRNFAKFTGKHLCQSLFLIKLHVLGLNFFQKRLCYKCFPVNFPKFLRRPFFYRTPRVAASTYPRLDSYNSINFSLFLPLLSIQLLSSNNGFKFILFK